ncbi:hypothetical protein NBRC116492_35370 [Aurantivibrio infirmus]
MNKAILAIGILLSFNTVAGVCTEIAKYDESMSEIYIVCPDLPSMSDDGLGTIINTIFKDNKFTPDEYTVNFVTSKQFLTQGSLTKENHVGFYYTHDHRFIIWPKNSAKTRYVQLHD